MFLTRRRNISFIKHIGKHGDRKVAIIFRMVPGEDHMCLVAYPDSLPKHFHDAIMKVIESQPGQQAENLSDVLHRNLLPDGRPILGTLHREGMIKKVASQQIVVTPNAQSHVKLDELNKILGSIAEGDEASKKMQDLDQNSGLVDPTQNRPPIQETQSLPDVDMNDFSDEGLAKQREAQSKMMEAEAKALLAESKRLQEEAWELDPTLKPVKEAKVARKKAVRKKAATRKKKDPVKVTESDESSVKEN